MSEGWVEVPLGDMLTRVRRAVDVEVGLVYPAASVLRDGQGLGDKEPFVGGSTNYKRLFQLKTDDVVVRTITAFESPVGVVGPRHDGTYVSQVFLTYEVTPIAIPGFLRLIFQTRPFFEEMRNRAQGSVLRRKTISDANFRAIPLSLPPLAVQRQIVDLIEHVDAHLNALETEHRSSSQYLRSARAALLARSTSAQARTIFDIRIGRQRSPARSVGPNMTPYLRAANVKDGSLDFEDVKEMDFGPEERDVFGLRLGDVLVSEGSGSRDAVGACAVVSSLPSPVTCFQNTLLRYRAIEGLSDPGFVHHWCRWAYESGAFRETAKGTNILHIGSRRAERMPVAQIDLGEQREIVAELDSWQNLVDALAGELRAARVLRQTLVTHLLSGEPEIPESYDALLGVS